MRKTVLVAVVSCAMAARSEDNCWRVDPVTGEASGCATDEAHWTLGTDSDAQQSIAPIFANVATDYTVTFPVGYRTTGSGLCLGVSAGQTLHVKGGDYLMSGRDIPSGWVPFRVAKYDGSWRSLFWIEYLSDAARQAGGVDWCGLDGTFSCSQDGQTFLADFMGGDLTATNVAAQMCFFPTGSGYFRDTTVQFRDGACLHTSGRFELIGNGVTNRFVLSGGRHSGNGMMVLYNASRCDWATEDPGCLEMRLERGAVLALHGSAGVELGSYAAARTTANKKIRVSLTDGSLWDGGSYTICSQCAGDVEVNVSGGSQMSFLGTWAFPRQSRDWGRAQAMANRFVVTDGGFLNAGAWFYLGSDNVYGDASDCPSAIYLTNGVLNVNYTLHVQAGDICAVDSAITNNSFCLGETTVQSRMDLSGGELRMLDQWNNETSAIGYTGAGALTATDGARVLAYGQKVWVGQEAGSEGAFVLKNGATFVGNEIAGGDGRSSFVADGGILAPAAATANLLHGLGSAQLTAKGLTVVSDNAVTIAQSLTNAAGEDGVLMLCGRGEKTLSGTASDVGKVVVSEGALVFADAARFASTVVVTNGASVNFGASAAAGTLKGLVLGDTESTATLVLSPEKKIAVDGTIALDHLRVALEGDFEQDTAYTVFEATGDVSEATLLAWESAFVVSGLPNDCVATFASGEEDGKTVFTMIIAQTAEHRITVQAGTSQTIGEVERYGANETLAVDVQEDGEAEITAALGSGGFVKEGRGILTLTSTENSFLGRLSTWGGLFAVPNLLALGFERFGLGTFTLGAGTLQLGQAGADEQRFEQQLVVETPEGAIPGVVVKTDSDIVMAAPEMRRGAILKRGAGRLTLEVEGETALTVTNAYAGINSGIQQKVQTFDEAGNVPAGEDAWYVGFNVLEGETVVRGIKPGARVETSHHVAVGLSVESCATNSGFVVDNATFVNSGYGCRFHLGCGIKGFVPNIESPYLFVTNNATFKCGWLSIGDNSAVLWPRLSPRIVVDHSVFDVTDLRVSGDWCYPEWTFRNGARFYSWQLYAGAKQANFVFDASICAKNADLEPLEYYDSYSYYERDSTFRNGSLFCCNSIVANAGATSCTNFWNFDDSEWRPAKGDFAFSFPNAWNQLVRVTGRGLILAPPAGATWRMPLKVTGEGGLVKRGAGTLVFDTNEAHGEKVAGDPVTLDCTGTVAVEEGTLRVLRDTPRTGMTFAVADGATLDFADAEMTDVTVAGAGRVTGGTISGLTIVPGDGEVVMFESAALGGSVSVDFARTPENPLEPGSYVIARYTGAAPSFAKWKAKGFGRRGLLVAYKAADGVITAKVGVSGMMMIIR